MKQVTEIANNVLQAKVATNQDDEISHLKAAVQAEDQLGYDEPPDFFYPARESLGGALLRAGKAAEAEQVFRDDLAKNPGNGRSLFGLAQALKVEGKGAEVAKAEQDFRKAWQWADTKLTISDL